MDNKNVFPASEMKKAVLDCYELPNDADLFEIFGDVLKPLPSWKYNFKGFTNPKQTKNCFIRYCNWFYSPDLTCIEKIYPEERPRKTAIAIMAGFDVNDNGDFDKKIDLMLRGHNQTTNMMIIEFLKIQGSDEWTTFKWLRDVYYKNMEKQSNIDGLELKRILEALDQLRNLRQQFLKGDTSHALNRTLIQRIEAEDLKLSPEAIAENIAAGKSPIGFSAY